MKYINCGRRSGDSESAVSMIRKKVSNVFCGVIRQRVFVAVKEGKIVGSILCGHDGRQGSLYHVCVDEAYRRHGIGKDMVVHSMKALQEEKINKVCLIAFAQNNVGNAFWNTIGWTERLDVNYYDFILNEENITAFNEQ